MKLRRRDIPILLGLLALLFNFWLVLTENPGVRLFIERIEHLIYDIRLQAGLVFENKKKPNIVIVDVDEKSLRQEGRWPWSREKLGLLVDKLFSHHVALIGFDVVFAEKETTAADARFSTVLANREIVLGFLFHHEPGDPTGKLPESSIATPNLGFGVIPELTSYTGNILPIQTAHQSAGFLTNFRDEDGIVRRSPLVLVFQKTAYPALSLELARRYFAINKIELTMAQEGHQTVMDSIRLGSLRIDTDALGQVLVPFSGKPKYFTTISAADVLSGRVDPTHLENTIVLVGTSALGVGDLLATPVSPVYPGVEIHASLLAGIVNQAFHRAPSWSQGTEWVLMALVGLALVMVLPRLGPLMMLCVGIFTVLFLIIFNLWLWIAPRLALELSLLLLTIFSILTVNLAYGFFVEGRRRQELRTMFGQYVPEQHIEEMANEDNPQFGFEGEAREMSVLFADIRDFTTLAEPLSAVELKTLLNQFLTPMTEVIFRHGGTIDKYVGDMIMAFWGAPRYDSEHAKHALTAALAMLETTQKISAVFQEKGLPRIQIGIGIHTGMMNVGDMGSSFRRSYTVVGDAVNLASRLENLTKHYEIPILVSESMLPQQSEFIFMKIDKVRVKGKQQPITIYQPIGPIETISKAMYEEIQAFEIAVGHYLWGRWPEASTSFLELQKAFGPKRLFSVYLERITHLSTRPKDEWDGVYTMLEK